MKVVKRSLFIVGLFCLLASTNAQTQTDSLLRHWQTQAENLSISDQVDLLEEIGLAYKYSKPDSAFYYFGLAAAMAGENQLFIKEANLSSRMGGAKYILGDYDNALRFFSLALDKHKIIENKNGIAVGLNNIGLIYNMQDEFDKAIEYHNKSVSICLEIKDTLLLSRNYSNLAIVYKSINQYDQAIFYVDSAIESSRLIHREGEYPLLFNLKGDILYKMNDYNQADDYYSKALELKHLNNKWEECYALAGLSLLRQSQGNFDESIAYGTEAYHIALEIAAKWDLQNITKILAESHAFAGDYENAYHYQRLYKEYSDSIFNEEKERTISYLHLKRKEAENEKLKADIEVNQQIINNRNGFIIAFITCIILLAFVIILQFRKNAIKTSLNEALRRKKIEIDKQNEALTQLNATKDTFFRIIAHDLKSPLGIMISFTDLLKENLQDFNNDEILSFIKRLHSTSTEGFKLLENLLDWARSQSGNMIYAPKEINLFELVVENILLMETNAKEKQITINNSISEKQLVYVDKNMTATVVRNLLSNAVKFTPANGKIDIYTKEIGDKIQVCIEDTGVGMSNKDQEKLFHIETQLQTNGTLNEKGSGIGLILCKEMVEKQGGTITYESVVGKGTCFCFTLRAHEPSKS